MPIPPPGSSRAGRPGLLPSCTVTERIARCGEASRDTMVHSAPGGGVPALAVDTVSRCERSPKVFPASLQAGGCLYTLDPRVPGLHGRPRSAGRVRRGRTAMTCAAAWHADRLTAPRGWDVVRLPAAGTRRVRGGGGRRPGGTGERRPRRATTPRTPGRAGRLQGVGDPGRRGHLRRSCDRHRRTLAAAAQATRRFSPFLAGHRAGPEGRPVGSVRGIAAAAATAAGARGRPGGRLREDLQGVRHPRCRP